ncbi:hypothetical protein U1Q18_030665 [Sarracenia purpurea var. burkii]
MAKSSQVPTFGNWESEENVPYTTYFDNATKKKGGGKMNPNEPQVNKSPVRASPLKQKVELKGQKETAAIRSKHEHRKSHEDGQLQRLTDSSLHHDVRGEAVDMSHQHYDAKVEFEAQKGSDVLRTRNECQPSREEGDLRRPIDSPLRHETVGRRATVDSPHHHHGGSSAGETPKRVTRQSAGFDRSLDHSPLHPHYQARIGGKVSGVSSPSWEKKGSSEGSHGLAPSTPGRSRLRSVNRGDGTPDHTPAVPKFGEWDESDPASAEGYSHIFAKVREEKQLGAGKVPVMSTETSYFNGQKQYKTDNSKCCFCFPWGTK